MNTSLYSLLYFVSGRLSCVQKNPYRPIHQSVCVATVNLFAVIIYFIILYVATDIIERGICGVWYLPVLLSSIYVVAECLCGYTLL